MTKGINIPDKIYVKKLKLSDLWKPWLLSEDEKEELVYKYFERKDDKNTKQYTRKSWLKHHPEDLMMDDENMRMRTKYDDDGIRALMAAICLRACADYQRATHNKTYEPNLPPYIIKIDCRQHFDSEMMNYFTNGMTIEEIERIINDLPDSQNIATIWRKAEK